MNFRVGQKVVCIHTGKWSGGHGDEIKPEYGEVYTVRDVREVGGFPWVWLVEIVNQPHKYISLGVFMETGFRPDNFRPVVERKTDISIFTRMLDTTKTPQVTPAQ